VLWYLVFVALVWLVCTGCPVGCMRCDCGGAYYFTLLVLITGITMYYHVFAKCGSRSSALTGDGRVSFSRGACVCWHI
jgi:hypothetical protein